MSGSATGARTLRTASGRAIGELMRALASVALILAPPALRIALAVPFFRSGLTRWDGLFSLAPSAAYLFEEEFKLHLLGHEYGFPAPLIVAHFTGVAEIALPILLVMGFATRLAALGLLIMTGVIQLVVPDGWANFHLPWAAMAIAIVALGAGRLSFDHLIGRALTRQSLAGS